MKMNVSSIFAVVILATVLMPNVSSAQRSRPLRVAFWNLENFFDPADDKSTAADDEFTPRGEYRWSYKRFEQKCQTIGKSIVAMELPVVVGLAEVENDGALASLCKGTALRNAQYGYVHYDSPDRRGIDCALLYKQDRFSLLEQRRFSMTDYSVDFRTRDVLMVGGVVDASDTLFVIVNHWPSQLGASEADLHRQRIADFVLNLRDSLLRTHPQSLVLVMGDFNTELAQGQGVGTYKYQGAWSWIDQILLGKEYDGLNHLKTLVATKPFSAEWLQINDDRYLGTKPFRTFLGPKYQGGVSDHLPVYRDL